MKATNRLAEETSPYLLQHAQNPVNWYPWSGEALAKAKEEDKLILVSIGYSACHWCHVMEKESFEDPATAYLMNQYFVCIKVDREERPDLDHFFMDALQAVSGQGGWPLNMFLTPDAKPFYGGTYFPFQAMHHRISWKELLVQLQDAFTKRRAEVEIQADHLVAHLQKANQVAPASIFSVEAPLEEVFPRQQIETIFLQLMASADTEDGGFGRAPKFPATHAIQFLLRYYHFFGEERALKHAMLSLKKMMRGGMYDHVGGGFFRYATDAQWKVPHFEKMAYDHAQLLMVLTEAFQLTKDEEVQDVIIETVGFLKREMLQEEGGFYAALDADSEGVEGKFYVWDKEELNAIVGKQAERLCEYYHLNAAGNWEHTNILFATESPQEWSKKLEIPFEKAKKILRDAKGQLLKARASRTRPGLDDKIILGWNALLAAALFRAASVFKEASWKQMAEKNTEFLLSTFFDETKQQWKHTYKNHIAKFPAFLDDVAYLVQLLIIAHEATASLKYLHEAKKITEYIIEHFSDEAAVFFYYTPAFHKEVLVRKIDVYDGATPSGNSIMASNLMKLGLIFNMPAWRIRSSNMLGTVASALVRYPTSYGQWGNLYLELNRGIHELVIIGQDALQASDTLFSAFLPNSVAIISVQSSSDIPLLANKPCGETTQFYLCNSYGCQHPVGNAEEVLQLIKKSDA